MGSLFIELSEVDVRKLVKSHIESIIGASVEESDVNIEVKSKQNYKSEWEQAAFRVKVHSTI